MPLTVDTLEDCSLYTIGHSTHTAAELIAMLRHHGVHILVDVRTVPRSRHNPQFNRDALPATLEAAAMDYVHLPALGGLRRPRPDSPNQGWRNASFRGFADYMQTAEFEAGLQALDDLAARRTVALMCAEAVPWRCHRSLIADVLEARGVPVHHIMGPTTSQRHRMTPFAVVEGTRVWYPAPTTELDLPLD